MIFFNYLKYFLLKLILFYLVGDFILGNSVLLSEISGSIWKINCKVGDVVESGQEVLVIESMKMEIPVVSNVKGTVISIFVNEGEMVNEDQKLIEIT